MKISRKGLSCALFLAFLFFLVVTLAPGSALSGSGVDSDHNLTAIGKSRDHPGEMFNDYGEACVYCHMWFYEDPPNVEVKPSFITTDLSDDHPVSFEYNAQLVIDDGGLESSSAPSGLGGSIAEDMLIGGKVECPTCHNVHDPLFSSSPTTTVRCA